MKNKNITDNKDIISGTFRRPDPTQENSRSFKVVTLVSTRK